VFRLVELDAIRVLCRTKMRDGRLPRTGNAVTFGRPGDGKICDACGETLTASRLMMEVPNHATATVFFHGDCYLLWMEERAATS